MFFSDIQWFRAKWR